MTKKALIVVDMQNDFIDGSLGTAEAKAIVPNVVELIKKFDGPIYVTRDTHQDSYLDTLEGRRLPVKHCVEGTDGWKLNVDVQKALNDKSGIIRLYMKDTFGCPSVFKDIPNDIEEIVVVGLCTDICVVSNVMLAKSLSKNIEVTVLRDCCAGVTPETHEAALKTMQMCQVNITTLKEFYA